MNVKYALYSIPIIGYFPVLKKDWSLGSSLTILKDPQSILKTLPDDHWKRWLGTIAWDQLHASKHIVLTTIPTKRPDVNDRENTELSDFLIGPVRDALMLLGPFNGTERDGHLITGSGILTRGDLTIQTMQSHLKVDRWVPPMFRMNNEYWKFLNDNFPEEKVIAEWTYLIQKLKEFPYSESNFLFHLSLTLFKEGLSKTWLDLSLPNIVRSIETIIALPDKNKIRSRLGPRVGMKSEFVRRVLKYYPFDEVQLYNLNRVEVEECLKRIYQMRSDSVHGMPIQFSLRRENPNLTDSELEKLEYITETSARSLLKLTLTDERFRTSIQNREFLEEAWLENTI